MTLKNPKHRKAIAFAILILILFSAPMFQVFTSNPDLSVDAMDAISRENGQSALRIHDEGGGSWDGRTSSLSGWWYGERDDTERYLWKGYITLRVEALGTSLDLDPVGQGGADPYIRASVNGEWVTSPVYDDAMGERFGPLDIYDVDWVHTWTVSTIDPQVLVYIQLWDYDNEAVDKEDDAVDIDPNGGLDLELWYNVETKSWHGDTNTSFARGERGNHWGTLWFYIESDITGDIEARNVLKDCERGYLNTMPASFMDGNALYTVDSFSEVMDNYTIDVGDGDGLNISLIQCRNGEDFDLYLYSPSGDLKATSATSSGVETIRYQADVGGEWRICVRAAEGEGPYQLLINGDMNRSVIPTYDLEFDFKGCVPRPMDPMLVPIRAINFEFEVTIRNIGVRDGLAAVYLDNIDPDFYIISRFDMAVGCAKASNAVMFFVPLHVGEGVEIEFYPFYMDNDLYFIAMGDNRPPESGTQLPGGQLEQPQDFYDIMEWSNFISPYFIVDTGDLVDGLGIMDYESTSGPIYESPVTDEEYYYFYDVLKRNRGMFLTTVGNHDVSRGIDVNNAGDGEQIYTDWLFPLWYSFDYADAHFIAVDPYQDKNDWWILPNGYHTWGGYIRGEQFEWMKADLEANSNKSVSVFLCHIPIVPALDKNQDDVNEGFNNMSNRVDVLWTLLNNSVDLLLVSHDHNYYYYYTGLAVNESSGGWKAASSYMQWNLSIPTLLSGGAGAEMSSYPVDFHHFALVHANLTTGSIEHMIMDPHHINILREIDVSSVMGDGWINLSNNGDYNLPFLRTKVLIPGNYSNFNAVDTLSNEVMESHTLQWNGYTAVYVECTLNKGAQRRIHLVPVDESAIFDPSIIDVEPFKDSCHYAPATYRPVLTVANMGERAYANLRYDVAIYNENGMCVYNAWGYLDGRLMSHVPYTIEITTEWTVVEEGNYSMRVSLLSPYDTNPANNSMAIGFAIGVFIDGGIVSLSPFIDGGRYKPGIYAMEVGIINTGTMPIKGRVVCEISPVNTTANATGFRAEEIVKDSIQPSSTSIVQISTVWSPPYQGTYHINISYVLEGDEWDGNNYYNITITIDKAPLIYGLTIKPNIFNALISFSTDEPARCDIYYARVFPLDRVVSEENYTTTHAVVISDLEAETTYYFEIRAYDLQGNSSINDNNGYKYKFTTEPNINMPPTLTDGGCLPKKGYSTEMFTFYVTYRDEDNDYPQYVRVNIDGDFYPMQESDPADSNTVDGKGYFYMTLLNDSQHTYYFTASDWTVNVKSDVMTGPSVLAVEEHRENGTYMRIAKIGEGYVKIKLLHTTGLDIEAQAFIQVIATYGYWEWAYLEIDVGPFVNASTNISTLQPFFAGSKGLVPIKNYTLDLTRGVMIINVTERLGLITLIGKEYVAVIGGGGKPQLLHQEVQDLGNGRYLFVVRVRDDSASVGVSVVIGHSYPMALNSGNISQPEGAEYTLLLELNGLSEYYLNVSDGYNHVLFGPYGPNSTPEGNGTGGGGKVEGGVWSYASLAGLTALFGLALLAIGILVVKGRIHIPFKTWKGAKIGGDGREGEAGSNAKAGRVNKGSENLIYTMNEPEPAHYAVRYEEVGTVRVLCPQCGSEYVVKKGDSGVCPVCGSETGDRGAGGI